MIFSEIPSEKEAADERAQATAKEERGNVMNDDSLPLITDNVPLVEIEFQSRITQA
ncbi:hypothetical protein AG0111_0g4667 [Alternaria gaisen]|uniref:Uncharacterized protein n=1 Tax=Alternaria gaisen TaxID=167740 RepID=A0ACB6FS05_9PLEO|nr:hypothetical protein AG0111_0g4667 [Alternaria gaisen]